MHSTFIFALIPLRALFLASSLTATLTSCSKDSSQLDPAISQPNPRGQEEAKQKQQQKQEQEAAADLGVAMPEQIELQAERIAVRALDSQWSDANVLVELAAEVDVPQGRLLERMVWTQTAGSPSMILTPEQASTQVLVPNVTEQELLSFRLAAMDSSGYVGSATTYVHVLPVNNPLHIATAQAGESTEQLLFRLRLQEPAAEVTSFSYQTVDATAIAGLDYLTASGSIAFAAGEQEQILSIRLLDDKYREGEEYFALRVNGSLNDQPSYSMGFGIIVDDEQGAVVRSTAPFAEGPSDQDQVQLGGRLADVRFQLQWQEVDTELGLVVIDPCMNRISPDSPTATCRSVLGQLDAGPNRATEQNTHWASGAPAGEFRVSLEHTVGMPTDYVLRAYYGERSQMLTGRIGNGDTIELMQFYFSGTSVPKTEPSPSSSSTSSSSGSSSSSSTGGYLAGAALAPVPIAAGGSHTLVIGEDGTVAAWGLARFGQISVPEGLDDVVALSAGPLSSLAITSTGGVVSWGDVREQEMVPAGLSDVVSVAVDYGYSLALKNDGSLVAWGSKFNPSDLPKLEDVVAIDAGGGTSLALSLGGRIVAWSHSVAGLGYAASMPSELSNVIDIAAGTTHGLALLEDGTVVAWGDNEYGQTDVPRGLTGVKAIAAGDGHSLALKVDGTVVMWGLQRAGNVQKELESELTDIVAIAAGERHSLALRDDGLLIAWGSNSNGQSHVPEGLIVRVPQGARKH